MANQILFPDADVAGAWQKQSPVPVNAGTYTEPLILGTDTAGYQAGDSASASDISEALALPDIGVSGGGTIVPVGSLKHDAGATYATSHVIELPSVTVLAGDLIEVVCYTAANPAPGIPATIPGYTQRSHLTDSVAFRPEYTKLYRIATGGEGGSSITVTVAPSIQYRLTAFVTIWRGVDQASPYAATPTVSYGNNNPNPPSVTTTLDGAVVTTYALGNKNGGLSYTAPATYGVFADSAPDDRSIIGIYKTIPTAGAEDAAAFAWLVDNSTVVSDALRPASSVELTALVFAAVVDGTETAELGGADVPTLAGATFSLVDSFNVPRSSSWRPQAHLWAAPLTSYVAGAFVDITVGDADGLHSWSAMLIIVPNLEVGDEVEDIGTVLTGYAAVAEFGTVTPSTDGAKVLAFMVKTPSGWHYTTSPETGGDTPIPSVPGGYTEVAEADSDAIVASAWISPPVVAGQAVSPSPTVWSAVEDWMTALVTLQPDVGSVTGGGLADVLAQADENTYVEIATAAGAMDEVVELDLSSIPTNGVITAVSINISHFCPVANKLRVELVGINSDDTLVYGGELKAGYISAPTATTDVDTGTWSTLSDGSNLFDFTRLGVRLFSTDRPPTLETHKIYTVSADVEYIEGGAVASNVVGPASPGDPVTWDHSSPAGLGQTHFEVMLISGSGQDPEAATAAANPLDPSSGEIVYGSGQMAGVLTRSLSIATAPIGSGAMTAAVRTWSRVSADAVVPSAWATANYNVTGAAPSNPVQTGNGQPTLNAATGAVDVTVDVPTSVSRAWLLRSADSGATFEVTSGSPFVVVASASGVVLADARAPLAATGLRWQVAFDNGAMTETSAPQPVGPTVVDIATPITEWYMFSASDSSLDFAPDVARVARQKLRNSVTVSQPGNSMALSSLPLGSLIDMVVRTETEASRLQLEAMLDSGTFRLVNILGQEWTVKVVGEETPALQIWEPADTETTQLKDGHMTTFKLREVRQ